MRGWQSFVWAGVKGRTASAAASALRFVWEGGSHLYGSVAVICMGLGSASHNVREAFTGYKAAYRAAYET